MEKIKHYYNIWLLAPMVFLFELTFGLIRDYGTIIPAFRVDFELILLGVAIIVIPFVCGFMYHKTKID